ncbi:hypothetical protein MRX96_056912 [Rhipicephalus microplus]
MGIPEDNVQSWQALQLSRAKLKASRGTSALLSGFAMVALVEMQLSKAIPPGAADSFQRVHHTAACLDGTGTASKSPHEKMRLYIETAWAVSTVFGLLLFMSEIAIISWIVFYSYSPEAALAVTIILIPVAIVFLVFAVHFYRQLVTHKYEQSVMCISELESMANQLQDGGVAGSDHEALHQNV